MSFASRVINQMIITGNRNKIVNLSVCQWEFDETNNKIEINNNVKEISYEIVCEHGTNCSN